MMRVSIFGQPFWVKRLAEQLNRYGRESVRSDAICLFCMNQQSMRDIKSADVFIRVGYRPGAATWRGMGFDAFWSVVRTINQRARVFYFWIGTDVLDAIRDSKTKAGGRRLEKAKRDKHLAGAPWLTRELAEIGIEASTTYLLGTCVPLSDPPLPTRFSVLTYVPDLRYRFYGGPLIYDCAVALPMIHFDVIGGRGDWALHQLPNLQFWGWQPDVANFYRKSVAVMRLVEHDGVGATAIEGLAASRHVLYSYPLPFTEHVCFGDTTGARTALTALFTSYTNGQLYPNRAGREYALAQFDREQVTQRLIETLESNHGSQ
jgi:hypothetical protein